MSHPSFNIPRESKLPMLISIWIVVYSSSEVITNMNDRNDTLSWWEAYNCVTSVGSNMTKSSWFGRDPTRFASPFWY